MNKKLPLILILFILLSGCGPLRITKSIDYRLRNAASYGSTRQVAALLKSGAYIDHQDRILKYTPLIAAIIRRSYRMANYLLDHGADPNIKDKYGKNAVHYCIVKGQLKLAKKCLEKGGSINLKYSGRSRKGSLVQDLARGDGSSRLKFVLDNKPSARRHLNKHFYRDDTPMHIAADRNKKKTAKFLLQYDVDLDARNKFDATPLDLAMFKGNGEIGNMIIAKGGQYSQNWALVIAVKYGSFDVARDALQRGADPGFVINVYGTCPLTFACAAGRIDLVKLLVEAGAPLNKEKRYGRPLFTAAAGGSLQVVKYLVEKGADVNYESKTEWTAAMEAHRHGHNHIIKYLVGKGALSPVDVRKRRDRRRKARYAREERIEKIMKALSVAGRGLDGFNKGYYRSKGVKYESKYKK